jgi:hypothetical protein
LDMPPLGDRRPSHMMNEMLSLLPTGSSQNDYIFLGIFLRKLPATMREHLAAANHTTAAAMAELADVLWGMPTPLRARVASTDWFIHLPLVMLGIRSAWRPDSELPAEAVYGTQPLLPGQFLTAEDPPPPSFLSDLQQLLANRKTPPTAHHNTPAPLQLPGDLLQARHVLVRKDGHVPPLAAAYDGPFLVLERSLRTFKLQIGNKEENVSTLRLKACFSPPDVQVAQPPKRGRPPKIATPPSNNPPASLPAAQLPRAQRRRVSFRCPPTLPSPSTTVPPRLYPSGRPARSAGPPKRYLLSLDLLRRPQLGGEL